MSVLTSIGPWVDVFIFFLESDISPKRDYPIVIWNNHFYPNNYIFYNSEQLTVPNKINELRKRLSDPRIVEIWDYSSVNVDILKSLGYKNVKHVPPTSPKLYLDRLNQYKLSNPILYDVGFCGAISQRRLAILNKLKEENIKVLVSEEFGEIRDKSLAQCKIILNIHCDDNYQIFESARCEPWLALGVPVVSETSLDNDPRAINCEYHSIIDCIKIVLDKLNKPI